MFTGIISDIGTVLELEQKGDLRVRIGCSYDEAGIDIGCSICCNGICLTVIECGVSETTYFDVEISSESISKTNAQDWIIGTVLETLDVIAKNYNTLSAMQDQRISATLNEEKKFSKKEETAYQDLRTEIVELVNSLHLHNNRIEALIDQMYGINRKIMSIDSLF